MTPLQLAKTTAEVQWLADMASRQVKDFPLNDENPRNRAKIAAASYLRRAVTCLKLAQEELGK